MRLSKANIAGLASPLQQAEMKSILAGAWPPLKPLPVFKYETVEYRATIDFDKKRGEWVCRKISLPSNAVQELRGGLREITMALPHGEAEVFTEDAEQQEQELEKDANRRLQAIREWREHYENGALYFELRVHLSETQQTEIDDGLRLSLTARQLQFNPKNVAYVFDALSTAGGRFATLIEFAKRKKAKQGTEPEARGESAVPEAERTIDQHEQPVGISSRESEDILTKRLVRDQEAAEHCTDADELPAVSIKSVLPEQEEAYTASPQFEIETSEIADTDSASVVLHPDQEEQHSPAFTDFAAQTQRGRASADHGESSFSHFPALEISAFQVAVFAALFLSAAFAFTVGLNVGRGPLASRLQEAPKSPIAVDAKSRTLPVPADESTSAIAAPAVSSESAESIKREVSVGHAGAIEPESPAPDRLTPTMNATQDSPRSLTILVRRPARGSQAFRVSFGEKSIAATSSLTMSSQLSVLVSAEPRLGVAHKPSRLEAGDLVSFVLPRYPRPGERYGLPETIRVRATIGQVGQVREVKFLGGSSALLPATKAAIRQWRYRPTLLDKRPVQAQQDVTIEFRLPQYSSQVSTQHPANH